MIHKAFKTFEFDYLLDFNKQFRSPPEIVAYDTFSVDPRKGFDQFWDGKSYDQKGIEQKIQLR